MCLSFTAGDEGSEAFLPHDESSQALYFVSLSHDQLNSACRGCLGKRAAGPKPHSATHYSPTSSAGLGCTGLTEGWPRPGWRGQIWPLLWRCFGGKWSCRARSAPPHLLTGCSGLLLCLGSCALSSHVLVLSTPHHEPSGSKGSPAPHCTPWHSYRGNLPINLCKI